ncbi:MAG: GTPase ObgE [Actinomycetota bacterium]
MFLDEAKINIKAGNGGNGLVSFFNLKGKRKKIASGGTGGRGGDIIIKASARYNTLYRFRKKVHFKAENGGHGQPNNRNGKDGSDMVIEVPVGTMVREDDGRLIADLDREGKEVVMAVGGIGGRGNASFTSQARRFPAFAEFGEKTEESWIRLELRLLADVGLVGFPNAGKSTIISRVTAARPKIADYPFTTLVPNLGVVAADEDSFVIADIPGLIEGAHKGSGLGDKFLRHIMRTSIIVFVLDMAKIVFGQGDVAEDFKILKKELGLYGGGLFEKDYMVAVNKVDLVKDKEIINSNREKLKECTDAKILFISAVTGQGLDEMVSLLYRMVRKQKDKSGEPEAKEGEYRVYDIDTTSAADDKIELKKSGDEYLVKNKKLERMVQMTDLENEEALAYLMQRMDKMHVADRLKKMGVEEDSTVIIGKLVFELKE